MFIWPITKAVGDHYLLPGALTARSAGAWTEKNRPEYGTSKDKCTAQTAREGGTEGEGKSWKKELWGRRKWGKLKTDYSTYRYRDERQTKARTNRKILCKVLVRHHVPPQNLQFGFSLISNVSGSRNRITTSNMSVQNYVQVWDPLTEEMTAVNNVSFRATLYEFEVSLSCDGTNYPSIAETLGVGLRTLVFFL